MSVVYTTHPVAREEILKFASANKSVLSSIQRLLHTAARALSVPAAFSAIFTTTGQLRIHTWYGFDASASPESRFLKKELEFYHSIQIIPNADEFPAFSQDFWVTNGGVRFFASMPIKTASNSLIGIFCILDSEERTLSNDQRRLLQDFSNIASETILLRFETSINKHGYRKIEAEFNQYRDNQNRIIATLPVPLFAVDQAGTIQLWNRACVDMFGYTMEEITGRLAVDILVSHESREKVGTLIDRVYNRRRFSGIELDLQDKEGKKHNVQCRLFPQFDTKGDTAACIIVAKNQPGYSKAEHALKKTEAYYRESASDMRRFKLAFFSTMNYELRTPLTSIIGLADILKDQVDDANKEFTQLIGESAQDLLNTLEAVLDLAQLEGHSFEIHPEPVDLVEHTHSLVSSFLAAADEKDLVLSYSSNPGDHLIAYVDRAAQTRVMENLIGNAVKYTRKGEITVSIRSDHSKVIIEVQDSGIGISKEFIPHIFDAFLQESAGISRNFLGSGLGLAITKRLVELMDGSIEVSSKKGKGSTFTVYYPMVSA